MAKSKITKPIPQPVNDNKRKRCGDCFYNGECTDDLKKCPYLKKVKEV